MDQTILIQLVKSKALSAFLMTILTAVTKRHTSNNILI